MRKVVPLEPGCFWTELSNYALPNINWCEAQHCSFIVEPANTWSNLAYIIFAIIILVKFKSDYKKTANFFGYVLIFVGASSFIYHASYTFVLQVLDFVSMYALMFMFVIFNTQRLRPFSDKAAVWLFLAGVVFFTGLTLLFYKIDIKIQIIMLFLVFAVLISEITLYFKIDKKPRYKNFFLGFVLIAAAFTFSMLDQFNILCMPEHPFIQGHAIWHLLSAASIFSFFFFYSQFEGSQDT